ncbi:hypothetical protein FB45DRAFT_910484 [Roridomyces roridus]|uniref:Uncharacterized protein n=1 Tax=Roridomyces roridus TaxID=1738132 RepID=A0AAD7BZP8_9AGAR|nr:hypothetical protein FB45DRAFT_910484 [Roridomyces roridus]
MLSATRTQWKTAGLTRLSHGLRPTNFGRSRHIVSESQAIDPDEWLAPPDQYACVKALEPEPTPDDILSLQRPGRGPRPPPDSYARAAGLPKWRKLRRQHTPDGPIHDLMLSFRHDSMDLSLLLVRNTISQAQTRPSQVSSSAAPSLQQIVAMVEGRMMEGRTPRKIRALVAFLNAITPETVHQLEILRPKIEQHPGGHTLSIWTESVMLYLMGHRRYDAAVCLFYQNFICPGYLRDRVQRVAEEHMYRHLSSESLFLSAPKFRRDTLPPVMHLLLRCLIKLSSGPEELHALHTEVWTSFDISRWPYGAHQEILIFIRAFMKAGMSDSVAQLLARSGMDALIYMGTDHITLLYAYAITRNLPKVMHILELTREAHPQSWEPTCNHITVYLRNAGSVTGVEMIRMYRNIFASSENARLLCDADVPMVLELLDILKADVPHMCTRYNRIMKLFRRSSSLAGVKAVFAHGVASGEWPCLGRGALGNVSSLEAWMGLRNTHDIFTQRTYQDMMGGGFFIALSYGRDEMEAFVEEAKDRSLTFRSSSPATRYTSDELQAFVEEAGIVSAIPRSNPLCDGTIEGGIWHNRETSARHAQLSIMQSIKDIERFCSLNPNLDDTHVPFILQFFDRVKSTCFAARNWSPTDPIARHTDALYRDVANQFRRSNCAVGVWAVLVHRDRRSDVVIPPSKPATRVLNVLTENGPWEALELLQRTRAQLSAQDLVSVFDAFVKAKNIDGALLLEQWFLEGWDMDPPFDISMEAISETVRVLWQQSGRAD